MATATKVLILRFTRFAPSHICIRRIDFPSACVGTELLATTTDEELHCVYSLMANADGVHRRRQPSGATPGLAAASQNSLPAYSCYKPRCRSLRSYSNRRRYVG